MEKNTTKKHEPKPAPIFDPKRPTLGHQVVPWAYLGHLDETNYRSVYDERDIAALGVVLGQTGWHTSFVLNAWIATPEEVKACVAERQRELNRVQALGLKDKKFAQEYMLLQKQWCDDKGNIIPPVYMGNSGFRRSKAIVKANAWRLEHQGEEGVPEGFITDVPVMVKAYTSKVDRLYDQLDENQLRNKGAKNPSTAESFNICFELFKGGARESDFTKRFNRGTAQKYHRLCKLCTRFPDLEIQKRINSPLDANALNIERLDKEELMKLLTYADQTLEKARPEIDSLPQAKQAKKLENVMLDIEGHIDTELRKLSAGEKGPRTGMMNAKEVKTLKENNGDNPVAAATAEAIETKNTAKMSQVSRLAKACRQLVKLDNAGLLAQAESALDKLIQSIPVEEEVEEEVEV